MDDHPWATAAIRGEGVRYVPNVHPVLAGFLRVG